jgi:hypothetical protein
VRARSSLIVTSFFSSRQSLFLLLHFLLSVRCPLVGGPAPQVHAVQKITAQVVHPGFILAARTTCVGIALRRAAEQERPLLGIGWIANSLAVERIAALRLLSRRGQIKPEDPDVVGWNSKRGVSLGDQLTGSLVSASDD